MIFSAKVNLLVEAKTVVAVFLARRVEAKHKSGIVTKVIVTGLDTSKLRWTIGFL